MCVYLQQFMKGNPEDDLCLKELIWEIEFFGKDLVDEDGISNMNVAAVVAV